MRERAAVRILHEEHLALAAVLYSMRQVAARLGDAVGASDDVRLLHAMLDYIVEYPDRWHHPKEDAHLFAAVRVRDPDAAALVAELGREHIEGGRLIASLKSALGAFEAGASSGASFGTAVEHYWSFQWRHIRKEEDILLPLAEAVLADEDWDRIERAFRENDNPLFGIKPKDEATRLYQRILDLHRKAPPSRSRLRT